MAAVRVVACLCALSPLAGAHTVKGFYDISAESDLPEIHHKNTAFLGKFVFHDALSLHPDNSAPAPDASKQSFGTVEVKVWTASTHSMLYVFADRPDGGKELIYSFLVKENDYHTAISLEASDVEHRRWWYVYVHDATKADFSGTFELTFMQANGSHFSADQARLSSPAQPPPGGTLCAPSRPPPAPRNHARLLLLAPAT